MKHILIFLFSVFCFFTVFGKDNIPTTFDLKYTIDSYGTNPGTTPEEVKARLAALPTKVEMHYNQEVQSYIDRYVKHGRKQITSLLVRSAYYLPIFEKALKDAGLPEELKYLPIIESGLNARATSHAGAAGLWQFMPSAAKGYDLEINSNIDERRDPYLSSDRACRMLRDLYNMFGDWHLVLAAYNAGPGTVQKALKRAGGSNKSFWDISGFLPAETRKYVPLFIAMNYVMNYYSEHNVPEVPIVTPFTTDTIQVSKKMTLKEVTAMVDIPLEDLRTLNPQFRTDVIQASANRPRTLILPSPHAQEYKIKEGRPVSEPNVSKRTAVSVKLAGRNGSSASPTRSGTQQTVARKNDSNQKNDKLRNWNDDSYIDVPSKSDPNTFVRVRRSASHDGAGSH